MYKKIKFWLWKRNNRKQFNLYSTSARTKALEMEEKFKKQEEQ